MESGTFDMPQFVPFVRGAVKQNRTLWTTHLRQMYEMTELPRHRLIQAREKAGFASPSEAARAHRSINVNSLISNENGNRDISRKAAEKYGAAFGVDPGWILFGNNAPEKANDDDWASWEKRLRDAGQLETVRAIFESLIKVGTAASPPPAEQEKASSKARKAE